MIQYSKTNAIFCSFGIAIQFATHWKMYLRFVQVMPIEDTLVMLSTVFTAIMIPIYFSSFLERVNARSRSNRKTD